MKNSTFKNFHFIIILIIGLVFIGNSYSQVRVPFTPRDSDYSPGKTIYNLRGDFTMIGNSNLTLSSYGDLKNNSNNTMKYVDIDGDNSTVNSSSATLSLSDENGANPDCSNIVYAGLYWTGRNSNSFSNLDRRTVKFKAPGQSGYQTLIASSSDIMYPGDNNMFAGYIEVTSQVKAGGIGDYYVADIATTQGNGGSTGYYSGWGMVVVYENSKMNWRDITVFDGYAYVQGNTVTNHTIDVSGFKSVQNGDVSIKLGMMAGEGDVSISGDYFQIWDTTNTNWVSLSHSGNSTSNFFNSSIYTGGNSRNPNLLNNTGLDISMFEVPNPNNSIIGNNQTSTKFKYGSTQDTYIIFNVTFSVDAYIPEPEGILTAVSINGTPDPIVPEVEPGEIVQYNLDLYNNGTESISGTNITLPIPYTASFETGSIQYSLNPPLSSPPVPEPYYNPNLGPTGSIVWEIGSLPLPTTPGDLLASLTFNLIATTDCALLLNPDCVPDISLQGGISGVGDVSESEFNQPLIQGFEQSGSCLGEPIPTPVVIPIYTTDYANQYCQTYTLVRDFYYCNLNTTEIPITEVTPYFPAGTRFYNEYPLTGNTVVYTSSNPFPVQSATYYAVPPGESGCFYQFTVNVANINSIPSVTSINYCVGETATPLTATTTDPDYILLYYTDENPNTVGLPSITPDTNSPGEITYYVAEGIDETCMSPNKAPLVVTVYENIEITLESNTPTLCANSSDGTIDISISGGSGSYTYLWNDNASSTTQDVSNLPVGQYTVIVNDENVNCSTTAEFEILANDVTTPSITAPNNIVVEGCDTTEIKNGDLTTLSFSLSEVSISESQFITEGGTVNEENIDIITYQDTQSGSCPITVTRTFRITDNCGLSSTATQSIIIENTTPPIIDTNAFDTTVQCGPNNANQFNDWLSNNGYAVAYDNCGEPLTWSNNYGTFTDGCATTGETTVIFTVTDSCGNSSDTTATFTIADNTPPTLVGFPSDVNNNQPTCVDIPELNFSNYTEIVGDGNNSTFLQGEVFRFTNVAPGVNADITIVETFNASIPIFDDNSISSGSFRPQTKFVNLKNGDRAYVEYRIDFIDSSDNSPVIIPKFYTNFNDIDGNSSFGEVNWSQFATNYTLNNPTELNVIEEGPWIVATAGTTEYTGVTNANPQVNLTTLNTNQSSFSFRVGAVSRVANASASGRQHSLEFSCVGNYTDAVTISDEITLECSDLQPAETLTATDNCGDAIVTFEEVRTDGSCENQYTLNRTWTATDTCGNTTTRTLTINVIDTTPPTFEQSPLPADTTVDFDNLPDAEILTATDNCGTATVDFNEVSSGDVCTGSYTITRTWTATDACGLTNVHTQTLEVTQPTLTATITNVDDIICSNTASGGIDITVTGGTTPYTFAWDNGATSEDLTNVLAGTYNVTITDANDCSTTITAQILSNCTTAITDINNTYVNQAVSGNVLTNDYDFEGDNQTVTANTNPTNGTVSIDATGNYTYTPNPNYFGGDTFTYTICDDGTPQACDTATVYIEVIPESGPENEAPIANADTATTTESTPITVVVLANDFDPDADPISITGTSSPTYGTITVNTNGTIIYTPNPGYIGEDTFEYTICDDGIPALCDTATVTITVLPSGIQNTTNANDDAFNTTPTSPLTGNVLANDHDIEGDTQTVTTTTVTTVQGIIVNIDPNTGDFTYTPDPGYSGTDSFVYTICDNGTPQACDQATVYISIDGVADLNIVKTASSTTTGCLSEGDDISYSFTVTNPGDLLLNNITIYDDLLGGDITGTLTLTGDIDNDGVLTPSETWVFTAPTYTVTQANVDAGQITNNVIVKGFEPDGITQITAEDNYIIDAKNPDLYLCNDNGINIVKSAAIANGETCLVVGSEVTYTFTVTNTGTVSVSNLSIT
ncbi:Ig-like domain-containing protein, partial [Bizionia paragorgiae]|uniref:Ig-like domain-containing protein n=1 Tax=Bizionia paragorgiae TaxID=283786 RepID=UPI003A8DE6EF